MRLENYSVNQLANSVVETETNERFICKAKLCSLHDGHRNFRSRESKFDKVVDFRFNVGNPFLVDYSSVSFDRQS